MLYELFRPPYIDANPDAVEAIFTPTRDATHDATSDPGIAGVIKALKDEVTAPEGAIGALKARLQRQAEAITRGRERMEDREARHRERLERQFGGLDARLSAFRQTQSFLDQQIRIWTSNR